MIGLTRLLRRLRPAPDPLAEPMTPRDVVNARWLRLEAPFMSVGFGAASSFLPLFAMQMGASNTMVGWLTSGPALLSLLWLIPCGRLVQRAHTYLRPMLVALVSQRLLLLVFAAIPLLPPAWRAWGIVLLAMVLAVPNTLWTVSIDSGASELLSPRHFARVLGQRWGIGSFANVLGMFLLGRMLESVAFPLNFQLLFAGVGLVTVNSLWLIGRLQFPSRELAPAQTGPRIREPLAPRRIWHSYRPFILIEAGVLLAYLAFFAAMPLFRIYWVRDLGAAGGWVGTLAAAFAMGIGLGNILWGQWSREKRDRRFCLLAGIGIMALYPWCTAAVHSLTALVPVAALAGFFAAGNDMLLFKRVVTMTPLRQRPTYLAAHNVTVNVAAFVGPLVSTALIGPWGIRPVLALAGVLGLVGVVAIYRWGWSELRLGPAPAAETVPVGSGD